MESDSETPISQPHIFIIPNMLTNTIPTHRQEIKAYIILRVAIKRMMNVNILAITNPCKPDEMNAFSVSIQAHQFNAVYSTDLIDFGAFSLYSSK